MITKPLISLYIVIPVLVIILGVYTFVTVRKKKKIGYKIFGITRILIILVLTFFINLRIMEKEYNAEVEMKNLDVLFVVDTTMSMWAEDYDGDETRMSGVLKDTEYILDELSGSNFGLIRFDNKSQILAPFTQDHETVKDAFSTIKIPDSDYANGTSMNTAIEDTKALLESSNTKDKRLTILFFISDGEITDGSALQSFKELEPLVDTGAVLGYGTAKGGEMQYDDWGSYVRDPETGDHAVSKIDESTLKTIASDLDIDYIHMEDTDNVKYMVESIKNGSSLTIEKSDTVSYKDTYFYYAIPLLIMLIFEAVLFIRKGKL